MKKTYYDYASIERLTLSVAKQISRDKWVPDYVVGITRGGLFPAILLSNWFDCKMNTLDVSFRDGMECESNLWMAEDAFGYVPIEDRGQSATEVDPAYRKKILIVDDINDSGATLNWIKQDWQSSCLPNNAAWNTIWNSNVKVAVLFNRLNSSNNLNVDYSGLDITQDNDPGWIVFPWESWCGDE
ncbi:MAG: phosphoribosyltransferase [Candidatus Nanopelagicus sp.]